MRQEIDGDGLALELFRAYLHQILINGFFHADPHPGNVFLTDDGRVALLDLGMVSRLSPARQDQLLKLLLAVADGNGDRAADLALQIGEVIGEIDAPLAQVQVGRVMMELSRVSGTHGIRLPPELTMLGKTLLNLDTVGRSLSPDFDVNGALRDAAAALMQRRMRKSMAPSNLYAAALETKDFIEQLPGRVNRLLDAATNNQLRMKIELIDEGGIPAFAMIFFLAAAAGGMWLAVSIVRSDLPQKRRR